MQKLHLVGFTTDHEGLILSTRRGARSGSYRVVVDEALADAVEEARARQLEAAEAEAEVEEIVRPPRVESQLAVKEIQTRLRQGRSVTDVAKAAGVEPAWVERFAAPVFAEQAQVISTVLGARLERPRLGPSPLPIGDAVRAHLAERGTSLTPEEVRTAWSTRQLADGRWVVRATFKARGKDVKLRYDLADDTGQITAHDRPAAMYGYVAPPPKPPAPKPATERPAAKRATVTSGFRPEPTGKAVSPAARERERAALAMSKAAAKRSAEAERAKERRAKEKAQAAAREEREAAAAAARQAKEEAAARRAEERAAAEKARAAAAAQKAKEAAAKAKAKEREKREAAKAKERAKREAAKAKAAADRKAAAQKKRAEAALRAAERARATTAKAAKGGPAKRTGAAKATPPPAKVTKTTKTSTPATVTKTAKASKTPKATKSAKAAKPRAAAKATASSRAASSPAQPVATATARRAVTPVEPGEAALRRADVPTARPRPPVPEAAIAPAARPPEPAELDGQLELLPADGPTDATSEERSTRAVFRAGLVEPTQAPTSSGWTDDAWAVDQRDEVDLRTWLDEPATPIAPAPASPEPSNGALRRRPPDRPRRTEPLRAT